MFLLLAFCAMSSSEASSPVQKVIELLDDTKGKVVADLAAEEKEMTEYSTFCDDTMEAKGYQIKTATRGIADLKATIEDCKATVAMKDEEIVTLGSELAKLDGELASATADREAAHTTFEATEKELVTTVDQMGRAIIEIKKSMSFLQTKDSHAHISKRLRMVAEALSKIADAAWVTEGNKRVLHQFLQSTQKMGEDDDLSLKQPQAKVVAYESHSGGIVETIEDMKGKAEESLTDARRAETKAQHSYKMMAQSLNNQIKNAMEKKSAATSVKAASTEEQSKAEGELAETEKTKAADTEYVATLKGECEMAAKEWAERQEQAKGELGAIAKAKEILAGVKVFVQVSTKSKSSGINIDADDDDDRTSAKRAAITKKLKDLARASHSFALMEMATAAGSDPFGKIRGLIEDMIAKLIAEAQEEATQKAFCDEEMAKSTKSQAEKTATLDKLTSRLDKATSTKAELEGAIKELESEVAEIDKSQAEATKLRTAENETYLKSSKDFKDSAEATERAIVVLKEYYEGTGLFVQVNSKSSKQPSFGGAKSDAGSSIISILEMAAEDFTSTYTEIETEEMEKVKAYEKMSDENKLAKAQKLADAKAKASEVKSLSVAIENTGTDKDMVSKELEAVLSYMDKLKPQCETKVMSYAEKKARREAEIEGLKEALQILDGSSVFLQEGAKKLRVVSSF